jgi:predicted nucleic acid-binding protein
MYLIDTDVISEQRKRDKANPGVREFFKEARRSGAAVYLSVITVGELRTGVERIRYRGDRPQAARLERWLNSLLAQYEEFILPVDAAIAEIWGRLRVPNPENPLDKQVAATALVYGLTVVTRNSSHFSSTGADILNPFR